MNSRIQCKFQRFGIAAATAIGLSVAAAPCLAQQFLPGTYSTAFYYVGTNTPTGVQLSTQTGSVTIAQAQSIGNLDVTVGGFSLTVEVNGSVATLATGPVDNGVETVQSMAMLSDANNMALVLLATPNQPNPNAPVSFITALWQANPALAGPSILDGTFTSSADIGNPNMSSPPYTLSGQSLGGTFTMTKTGATSYTLASTSRDFTVPLVGSGSNATLDSPPIVTPIAIQNALSLVTDVNGHGAFTQVGTELYNATDVSVGIALFTISAIPEPTTASLTLAGLITLLLLLPGHSVLRNRGRSRVRAPS